MSIHSDLCNLCNRMDRIGHDGLGLGGTGKLWGSNFISHCMGGLGYIAKILAGLLIAGIMSMMEWH